MKSNPVSTRVSPESETQGGVHHLLEAIGLNCQRLMGYAIRTRGRSLPLSLALITTELLSLWTLSVFDLWGWFFNRNGVGVIANDFVSMSLASPPHGPPSYRGIATNSQASLLQNVVIEYQQSARALAKSYNFQSLANLTRTALRDVAEVEASTQCGYPMHRHLLESIGLAATNAVSYNQETDGQTNSICHRFILVQLLSLPGTMLLDRMAHFSHAQNVGILENDVPSIHF
jgi:hypothetical protein